ncbi:MAG: TerB family tellurite resistance protein [Chryseolinea sp.]
MKLKTFIVVILKIQVKAHWPSFEYIVLTKILMDNHQQKISHLKALFHLATADGELSKSELVYIMNVAERLGINREEILNFDGSEPALVLPDLQHTHYAIFHRLAIVIMIDNVASESEKRYCFNLGVKMGLHPNAVGEIIEHVVTEGPMKANPTAILAIFRKYMS